MGSNPKLLKGKPLAAAILEKAKSEISKMASKPRIAIVLVGDDEASKVFVGLKEKAAKEVGAEALVHRLDAKKSESNVLSLINKLNADKSVDGILVQLPLPKHINESAVLSRISPKKDIDGLTPENMGKLLLGQETIIPCTVAAILALLDAEGIKVEGKHVVVINRSSLIGKPLSMALLEHSATVTVCHTKTKDIAGHTKSADIIITATGKPGFLTADMVSNGAIVIDAGYAKRDGRPCGDADFESLSKKASAITPVPGGVGPVTVAMTMRNLLSCREQRMHKIDIRHQKLMERMSVSEEFRQAGSDTIRTMLQKQPEFSNANTVFVYVPIKNEVDTMELIEGLLKSDKRVAVPFVDSETKTIAASELKSIDELCNGHFGTLEPKKEFIRPVPPRAIDVSIIPGIAFDANGNRLGYGHGYYDKFLAATNAPIIALAFEFQIVDSIRNDMHDVCVDKIITEKRVVECG